MLKDILTSLGLRPADGGPGHALSGTDRAALKTYLQECDDLVAGVSGDILDYLLTGRNESLLLRVRALPGREARLSGHLPHVLVKPGPNGPVRDEAAVARNLARIKARRRCLLESESWDAGVFRRLGDVLVALHSRTGNPALDGPGTPNAPAWFRALVGAVHSTSMFNDHGHYSYSFGPLRSGVCSPCPACRPRWRRPRTAW
jgi:hypothetical protein